MAVNTNLSRGGQPSSSQISKLNRKTYLSLCISLYIKTLFASVIWTQVSDVLKQLDE